MSLTLDEGLILPLLQLIHSALSGIHPGEESKKTEDGSKSKEKDKEKEKEKEKEEEKETEEGKAKRAEFSKALTQLLFETVNDESFGKFLNRFLLQSNQSKIRWQAHSLVYCMYR